MNKKVTRILIAISIIVSIVFLVLIFNEKKYEFKYIKKTASIAKVKINGITNTYLSYKVGNKVINVEKNKYKENKKNIIIYYNPDDIFDYHIKKNLTFHYIIVILSFVLIITMFILEKKKKKNLYFYSFKKRQ